MGALDNVNDRGSDLWLAGRLLAALLIVLSSPCSSAQSGPAAEPELPAEGVTVALRDEMRRLIVEARDRVFPALVHIEATAVRYAEGREIKGRSGGSGALISDLGFVVTNHHVVEEGSNFVCTLADKRSVPAELVGADPLSDLAVLRLDLTALEPGSALRPAEFGDSSRLEVGDYVLAMGSPFTLSRSVSLGIVSNTERVFGPGVGGGDLGGIELELGQRTGLFTRWLQHDAALNPGNSGGPLVDLEGRIVGINQLGGDQVGFAIPSNLARGVVAALIERGRVSRSWIGITFKPLAGTGLKQGVLVSSLEVGGPAERAGLRVGDLLLRLGDEELAVRFLEEVPALMEKIAAYAVGSSLDLEFSRTEETGPQRSAIRLRTEEWPDDRGPRKALEQWGLAVQELTDKTVSDYSLATSRGVLVIGVRSGGPAALAEPAVAEGDVILAIDGQRTESLDPLLRSYRTWEAGPRADRVLLGLNRRGQSLYSVLAPRRRESLGRSMELPKAWLGVSVQPLNEQLARLLGMPEMRGLRVTQVYSDTKALAAGLQAGDIVRELDGVPLEVRGRQDADALNIALQGREIGDFVRLGLWRASQSHELVVELEPARSTPEGARRLTSDGFEMTVREVTALDRDEHLWDATVRGVLIEEVEPAGRARLAGLRPYDLVQKLGAFWVQDLAGYQRALERLGSARPESVSIVVRRGGRLFLNVLRPTW